MADKTGIEWADATWNPIVGCSIVSPGCTHCYAMKMAARIEAMQPERHYAGLTQPSKAGPVWTGKLALAPDHILTQPLRWRKPRTIFVNSMGDLAAADDYLIDIVFGIMALAPWHIFLVLTKRGENLRRYICGETRDCAEGEDKPDSIAAAVDRIRHTHAISRIVNPNIWPLPNVWIGASAERQPEYDARKGPLRATPAAKHFWSFEPLLGPIVADYLSDWAICGGESGKDARPMHPDWARGLRDQCAAADVPFFFKQWGEWTPGVNVDSDPGVRRLVTGAHYGPWEGGKEWAFSVEDLGDEHAHIDDEPDLFRVGKARAGRLLDGVEHSERPQP